MSDLTKKEFQLILKEELKDRPVSAEIHRLLENYPTREQLKDELKNHPTHDDLKTILHNQLKNYATKDDLKKLENKIDDMGQSIVDAIERGLSVKADQEEVQNLKVRVKKLEKTIVTN